MAYATNALSLLSGTIGGRNRRWYYESADALATILAAGYIADATNKRMQVGDIVEVYSGTLNTALTATPSTKAVGTVSEFASQPVSCQAMVASIASGAATLVPAGKRTVILPVQLADIATGTFKVGMPTAFIVLSALFRTGKAATTASKLATLTVGISGTPVTGGVMALTSANQNAIGGSVAASAITALNIGAPGNTLEVTASAVTAFVEGDGYVEFTVAELGN